MAKVDDLDGANWVSVPSAPYIMKHVFHDSGYHIMISNLTYLYSEKLEGASILKKFSELNPFVQMKLQVILENLRKSLEKYLTEESELGMNITSDKLIISLEFSAALVSCKYNFEMDLLNAEKITEHIISPTIFHALLSQKKFLELQKKIMTYESTKGSSLTPNVSISTQDAISPDWLKGKNVSTQNLLDSFLKIQSCFKDLHAENLDAYNASRKEKSKNDYSVQSMSTNKKFKQENLEGESISIKFEDSDEKLTTEDEETACSDNLASQMKNNAKKKKSFKI